MLCIFDADITIWMNTISEGRVEDTNKMFQEPDDANVIVESLFQKVITNNNTKEL